MKTSKLILILLLSWQAMAARDFPAYHAVISSTRTYMDVSRNTQSDYWFTKDKTYISNGRVITIERKDLGVVYTLIVRSNEYYIDTIKPEKTQEKTTEEIDFRYVGVDRMVSDYDWVVGKKSKNDQSGLFKADHYTADGDADFDQVALEFWLAKPGNREMAGLFNKLIQNSMSYNKTRKPLVDMLKKDKYRVPVRIVEMLENPIAPPAKTEFIVEKLEPATAPANIFELPAGAKQAKK
ncbi:MAG: hypothetical protein V2A67_11210 [Bacteroidota bacterium]